PPDAHIGERRDRALVQRDVLVRVAGRLMDGQPRNRGDLAVLVPRHERDDVNLAALQLIDPRVGVRDELEQQLPDPRELVAAPVVRHALETNVFAGLPFGDAVWPGAKRTTVVVLRA